MYLHAMPAAEIAAAIEAQDARMRRLSRIYAGTADAARRDEIVRVYERQWHTRRLLIDEQLRRRGIKGVPAPTAD